MTKVSALYFCGRWCKVTWRKGFKTFCDPILGPFAIVTLDQPDLIFSLIFCIKPVMILIEQKVEHLFTVILFVQLYYDLISGRHGGIITHSKREVYDFAYQRPPQANQNDQS